MCKNHGDEELKARDLSILLGDLLLGLLLKIIETFVLANLARLGVRLSFIAPVLTSTMPVASLCIHGYQCFY